MAGIVDDDGYLSDGTGRSLHFFDMLKQRLVLSSGKLSLGTSFHISQSILQVAETFPSNGFLPLSFLNALASDRSTVSTSTYARFSPIQRFIALKRINTESCIHVRRLSASDPHIHARRLMPSSLSESLELRTFNWNIQSRPRMSSSC